ncbi:SH3 domain-binding protein 5-like [Octodon degus]|uniref:SH3 domain-binding protein 5 n=1 Tax=Octodon degus TaxID=10160 RepID=A0A6P3F895_OCTDE|nr:SH3 domain-binding protein 5-like [Octodon degus]XP_023556771.1 SH3 domain-binding protein 5-like [Octodon degus]
MAELRQVPGGRETPQGELRPEVVEDEVPGSPGAEEPGGGGSGSSSEPKLSPREEEELDPRIQEELEHLNQASEEINQVELQLDEARTTYRRILQESARKLNTQGSHLGSCIEKARPYYEARRLAKEAQQETQKAALRYERAVSMHNAAREMVFVAEQGVMADKNRLDPTWQEMLNHATCKVNEAEEERLRGEREHQRVTRLCQQAEARVQALQKTLRRAIGKSRPYFELKAQFSQILEEHKAKVTELEQQVAQAKTRYSVALRNLEQISEQIHARRRGLVNPRCSRRSSPVGAEAGPQGLEEADSGAEAGSEEVGLGAGVGPDTDSLSLLSLRTVASDLQKCDSVEHLRGLSDHASLDGQELGPRPGLHRDSDSGARGGRHQRSVSL